MGGSAFFLASHLSAVSALSTYISRYDFSEC